MVGHVLATYKCGDGSKVSLVLTTINWADFCFVVSCVGNPWILHKLLCSLFFAMVIDGAASSLDDLVKHHINIGLVLFVTMSKRIRKELQSSFLSHSVHNYAVDRGQAA